MKYRRSLQKTDYPFIIPKPEKREEIVLNAHLAGHFGINTTIQTIQEKYFWKKMERTVKNVIKKCTTCHTFQKQAIMNHPAKTITATTIFERIGIDLIGGLPETRDSFKYIMVITEHVSKYPYAVAIKNKSASEVAENLAVNISLFGPPKILLSDKVQNFVIL